MAYQDRQPAHRRSHPTRRNSSKWTSWRARRNGLRGVFSAVTALLLFFGVKEGVLDQAIRRNPFATLYVFILLGIGVLCALFAGAINPVKRIYLWALLAAIAIMLLLTALFLPNLDFPNLDVVRHVKSLFNGGSSASRQVLFPVLAGFFFLIGIVWSYLNKASLPAVAGVIVLGVAATSLGLYGAAKVSVGTKIGAVTPQVSASLEQANGQTSLKIVAVASRMSGEKLLISVSGVPRTQELPLRDAGGMTPGEIWQSVLQPNSLDEIDTTITVPIVPTRWELIWVSHCQVAEQRFREGKRNCTHRKEISLDLRLRNLTPEAGAEITGHIVVASAKSLKVTLTGRSVAWGSQIQAEICRAHNGGHARQLAFATLTPDLTGAVTWNVPVPAGGNGDELILQYRRCPGEDCPNPKKLENMTPLAKYVLP